jgi:acyl-coenzyme A thioesterase PaaI-like protein
MADDTLGIEPTDVESWLNDKSEYQRCFACGQQNPFGLQLYFYNEDRYVCCDFTGEERHQGFPGVIHGGILATLLDETMGRVTLLDRRWVMTGRLDLRYRAPTPIGVPLHICAEATDDRPRMVRVRGWITLADQPNNILCEAEGLFLPLPEEVRKQATVDWPGLLGYF